MLQEEFDDVRVIVDRRQMQWRLTKLKVITVRNSVSAALSTVWKLTGVCTTFVKFHNKLTMSVALTSA